MKAAIENLKAFRGHLTERVRDLTAEAARHMELASRASAQARRLQREMEDVDLALQALERQPQGPDMASGESAAYAPGPRQAEPFPAAPDQGCGIPLTRHRGT